MKSIALIGGAGFVGTRFMDLLKDKYSVTIFDKEKSQKYPDITTILDIRNKDSVKKDLEGFDVVVLLAAEHKDDVSPTSLYYEVNVEGTKNVLGAMDANGIKNIIFTSSVAVYGLNKVNPNEEFGVDPFNHYGKSKWLAEEELRKWYKENSNVKKLTIVRPTVIFGERNRGNVYNLLKQIASGRFLRIGTCDNKKSMAYVGNIVAFIEHLIDNSMQTASYELYNYVDKPDLSMNELVGVVGESLDKNIPAIKVPYFVGMLGGYCFDLMAKILKRKLSISSVRIKKFCATTQFDATKAHSSGFIAPYALQDGLHKTLRFEFVDKKEDDIVYISE